MKITLSYKFKSIILFIIIIPIFSPISCSTTVLDNSHGELALIKNVFYEAGYYSQDLETDMYTVYDIKKIQIGYAFLAEGISYSGKGFFSKPSAPMSILVGLVDKSTIKNIYVVSHGESIEFWDQLIDKCYFDQFTQLNIEDAALICDGGKIDAVTGATLSSMSVADIVREAALEKSKLIE